VFSPAPARRRTAAGARVPPPPRRRQPAAASTADTAHDSDARVRDTSPDGGRQTPPIIARKRGRASCVITGRVGVVGGFASVFF